jgi:hypothetical protein
MRAIGHILETFFVSVVYNRSSEGTCLEILGSAVHVEVAEYVAAVLSTTFERLWKEAKKTSHLEGITAKNSFFLGIAAGYCQKVQSLKKEHNPTEERALLVIEKQLLLAREMVYPRLLHSKRRAKYCPDASRLGEKMGREMQIQSALSSNRANQITIQ